METPAGRRRLGTPAAIFGQLRDGPTNMRAYAFSFAHLVIVSVLSTTAPLCLPHRGRTQMGSMSKRSGLGHSGSFLLGALLPTALLFFLASDRVGERLTSISSIGNGYLLNSPARQANLSAPAGADEVS